MSKKPWEEYKSDNHVEPQDTVVTEEKKPWEEFAQEGAIPLKKKDESVVEGPGTNASLAPAKPSEKNTESNSNLSRIRKFAQIEFNEFADKRHKELQAEYEADPTDANLGLINKRYEDDLSTKEKELNDVVTKFGGLYQKREQHKIKQEKALKDKPTITGTLAKLSGASTLKDILEYTGRSTVGILKDQIPAELRSEDLRVSGGTMEDMLTPRSNFGASGFKSKVITPELQAEFRKWNNKEATGATVQENIKTFLKNKFGEKYSLKEAEFKAEQGEYRKGIEKEIQQQNKEYADIIKDAPQDITDVDASNVGKFIGSMAGQGFGRIIPSLLTAGGSSLIAERSAVFNEQLDKASEKTGLSRDEIVSQGLDDPESGRVLADFLALTDIASVGNIAAGTGKKILRKAVGVAGEAAQEALQGEGEAYAGAKGAGVDYEFKPSRAATGAIGGVIGSTAVSSLLPGGKDTDVRTQSEPAKIKNENLLSIQRTIDPAKPETIERAAAAIEQEVNKPQANEEIKVEPVATIDPNLIIPEDQKEEGAAVQEQVEEPAPETQVEDPIVKEDIDTKKQEEVKKLVDQGKTLQQEADGIKEKWFTKSGKFKKNTPKEVLSRSSEIQKEFNDLRSQYNSNTSEVDFTDRPFAARQFEVGTLEKEAEKFYNEEGDPLPDVNLDDVQKNYDRRIEIERQDYLEGRGGQVTSAVAEARFEDAVERINDDFNGFKINKTTPEQETQKSNEQSTEQPTENTTSDIVQGSTSEEPGNEISGPAEGTTGEGGTPPASPSGTTTADEGGAKKQRKFSIQLLDSLDLSYQVKKGLSEDAITYIPKGIRISNSEARAIVEAKGSEQATKDFLDMTNGMLPDVRVMLGENLIKKFNEEENWDGAIKVADNLAMQLTDLGRGVNAAKVFQLLTPEGVIRYIQKEITKSKDKHSRDTEPKRKKSKKEVDTITEKAIAKVLDPQSEVSKSIVRSVKKGKVKQAIDFLEKLKIEQPKGMASSMIVPLGLPITAWNTAISIIQDALKAGLTISQAINKAIKRLKDKGHEIDESKFRAHFDDALKDYRVALDPEKAVKEELKSQGTTIDKIIRQHYTEQEVTKKSLVDKLVKDANLDAEEAKVITDQLVKTIDDLTRDAKEKALKKYLPKPKKGEEKAHKNLVDKIVEASNLGAMDEEEYRDAIASTLGPQSLTEEQGQEVKALAEKIQKAKSDFDKNKAQEDLIRYVDKNIKGIRKADLGMSIWYANILSGLSTQLQNLYGNVTKTLDEAYTASALNPKDAPWILKGLFQGYGRGFLEAADTFKSGYTPLKGDVKQIATSSPILESVRFKGGSWNPYNYLKYVTRLMGATDIFFYHGLKEMRSRELAVTMAKKVNKVNPSKSINADAKKAIYGDENAWRDAKEQAALEGYTSKDQTRRAYELIEKSRPEFIQNDSNDSALRGTYNNQPEGALGMLSGIINMGSEKLDIGGVKPIKFIVPFTKIIANVANTALDYSPWAFIRYAKGGIGYENFGENYYHKYTEEEKAKLLIRAVTGSIAMAALAALTDDDDGVFQITADGTGDMAKNFELMQTGWQPYSIKIGDKWYEYRNTPLAIPFAMVGYWRDGQKYHGKKEDSERLSILMYGTLKYIMDLSFLQSLSSFFDTFSKENASQGKNFFSKSTKETEKLAKSVLIPNAFTQASRSMQEIMNLPMKEAKDMGAQITRDMPVLRDRLDNMYNSLGDPVMANQVSKFLPFKMKSEPTGNDKELYDIIANNNAWIMKPGRGTVKIATGESMTDDEFEEFSYRAGKLTKQKLMENFAELKAMKDKEEVKDFIQKLKTQARREANLALFGEKSYF